MFKECNLIPVGLLDQHHLYLDKRTDQTRSAEEHVILHRNHNAMISHLNHSNSAEIRSGRLATLIPGSLNAGQTASVTCN